MDSFLRAAYPFFVPVLMAVAGCGGQSAAPKADPAEVASFREQFVLEEEPDGVQTVSEVRTALSGEAPPNVLALMEEEGEEGHDHAAHPEGDAAHDDHDHAEHGEDADHDAHDETAEADGEPHVGEDAAAELPESMEVTVVGVVGGVPNPMEQTVEEFPFAKGEAMFFLADPEAVADLEEHGHQHAPGEVCAFCAAHAADAQELIAAVTFKDAKDNLVRIDARDLFDLKEKETVVIHGTARLGAGGILTIEANGLYVRR